MHPSNDIEAMKLAGDSIISWSKQVVQERTICLVQTVELPASWNICWQLSGGDLQYIRKLTGTWPGAEKVWKGPSDLVRAFISGQYSTPVMHITHEVQTNSSYSDSLNMRGWEMRRIHDKMCNVNHYDASATASHFFSKSSSLSIHLWINRHNDKNEMCILVQWVFTRARLKYMTLNDRIYILCAHELLSDEYHPQVDIIANPMFEFKRYDHYNNCYR